MLLSALALAGLLVVAARGLGRSRRRSRRRSLLAVPDDVSDRLAAPDTGAVDDLLDDLRERPRPIGADEAARILGLESDELAALNLPATPAPDGGVVYDSWEIVHWMEVRRADPAAFAAKAGTG
jgi:hypothetical protein